MGIGGCQYTYEIHNRKRSRAGGVRGRARAPTGRVWQTRCRSVQTMHSRPQQRRSLGFTILTSSDMMPEEVRIVKPGLCACSGRSSTRPHGPGNERTKHMACACRHMDSRFYEQYVVLQGRMHRLRPHTSHDMACACARARSLEIHEALR